MKELSLIPVFSIKEIQMKYETYDWLHLSLKRYNFKRHFLYFLTVSFKYSFLKAHKK